MRRDRTSTRPGGAWPLVPAAAALAVGAGSAVILRAWRGFFWPHALIVGLAVAALVYSSWRAWRTLRPR